MTCLIYVLRERGEWARADELSRELIAAGTRGLGRRGHPRRDPRLPGQAQLRAAHAHLVAGDRPRRSATTTCAIDSTAGLAFVAAAEGAHDEAAAHCRALLERWEASEDHHYSIWGLRWAAGFLARRGDRAGAHACAEALTRIASDDRPPRTRSPRSPTRSARRRCWRATPTRPPSSSAARSRSTAASTFPFERAQIELRAGVALAARRRARARRSSASASAYRTARKLGARPLAAEAAEAGRRARRVGHRRLGRRAAADADADGLTRRELEVVRLVAVGRTNREIAQELFLSPRTVDMHVRNILRKLDCRSRVEAAHRAGELGLLA